MEFKVRLWCPKKELRGKGIDVEGTTFGTERL